MCCQLIHETVKTAAAAGLNFDEEKVREKVKNTSINNPNGCTSIRADLRDGRRTEVDTISGAVVRAAHKYGVEVPGHECIVRLVHAMEGRNK
ncbi:MAG: ketopantoate reductase family protein [Clostridium sp.]